MKKYRFEYFASCPTGLEDLLGQEIMDLGAKRIETIRGGVQFEAFHEIALKVILHSRLASRVFKFLFKFEVAHEKDYYLEATDIKWKSLMEVHHTFKITTIFGDLPREREEFRNSQFTNLKLKDAIVDYFRHFEGERPSVEKLNPDVAFLARIDRGEEKAYSATLMYDLCGFSLNQRGYRIAKTEAPVKENVAAGILKMIGWDPKKESLQDGMCGSGTFLIEGALMAANIAPSYLRVEKHLAAPNTKQWAFLNYSWFTKDEFLVDNFNKMVNEIKEDTMKGLERLANLQITISGNDQDRFTLISTQENLKKAKFDKFITITNKDVREIAPLSASTLFICNPPYGERLEHGEEEKLKALYKGLGDNWKQNYKGNRAALFTGNLDMLKSVGLRTTKRHIIYNGDIECRVAEYSLY